jgi:hypothetical protein
MNNFLNHQKLLDYTSSSLNVLQKLAEFFEKKDVSAYRDPIGSHIRHLIEHYETLIYSTSFAIDYDARQRDEVLEESPSEAIRRLDALRQKLQNWTSRDIDQPITVHSLGGHSGETIFINHSSVGRELCFLNSHAVHHLAVLKPICQKLGIAIDEYFGFAPSTIAYLESQKLEAL